MMTTVDLSGLPYGQIIRRYRLAYGMTLEDVAEQMDMTRTQLSQWERGKHHPNGMRLSKLAQVFGVTTAHLLGEVPFMAAWPNGEAS